MRMAIKLSLFTFIFLSAGVLFADGSFGTEEIEHILKQNPHLRSFIFHTMCVSDRGLAKRIGSDVNEHLAECVSAHMNWVGTQKACRAPTSSKSL